MGKYIINGGNKLNGEIEINGAKNAVLPILAATVLNDDISVIHNCPLISDTFIAVDILKSIGCKVNMEDKTLIIDASSVNNTNLPENLVCKMRSSVIFLGSMLGCKKNVTINYPGGCSLGARPIDMHINALKKMNAVINEENDIMKCSTEKLKGAKIELKYPSVGATENIILAAVLAEGITVINNAAREPEIYDLQNFLNSMGANVNGAGTGIITIHGVNKLHSVEHSIIPDRIEAGTYLAAVTAAGGEITLKNVIYSDIYPITEPFITLGCKIVSENNKIKIKAPEKIKNLNIIMTEPHPGFPTDMQPQLMSVLSLGEGKSTIIETVFEARNKHIAELVKMGADITSKSNRTFIINGVSEINGAEVEAKDLRGGAALIIAGLSANGKTVITHSEHIERGYENIEKKLKMLGADIEYKKN